MSRPRHVSGPYYFDTKGIRRKNRRWFTADEVVVEPTLFSDACIKDLIDNYIVPTMVDRFLLQQGFPYDLVVQTPRGDRSQGTEQGGGGAHNEESCRSESLDNLR